jgi:hypothetical protein
VYLVAAPFGSVVGTPASQLDGPSADALGVATASAASVPAIMATRRLPARFGLAIDTSLVSSSP